MTYIGYPQREYTLTPDILPVPPAEDPVEDPVEEPVKRPEKEPVRR